jgi:acyl carrier protein
LLSIPAAMRSTRSSGFLNREQGYVAMNNDDIRMTLQGIARDIFEDETLVITDASSKDDLKAWDSLGHIRLMTATEEAFGVSFTLDEIENVSSIGQIVALVSEKL